MNSMDIFYDSDWIDFQEQISIRKVLKSEAVSIYYIDLPNHNIKLRFDDNADAVTKLWNHTKDISDIYPREWYMYIVDQIAELRMCSADEVMELLFYLGDLKNFVDYDE